VLHPVGRASGHRERLRNARKLRQDAVPLRAARRQQASLLLHGKYVAADRLRPGGAGKEPLWTDVYHKLEVAHKVYSQDGEADVGE
jgi:hypothetical protein